MLRSGQGFLNQSEELHNMVSDILQDYVQEDWCVIFHDNIYVIGPDIDSTTSRWAKVLQKLAENNLKLSPEKTSCFPSNLDLLGLIKKEDFSAQTHIVRMPYCKQLYPQQLNNCVRTLDLIRHSIDANLKYEKYLAQYKNSFRIMCLARKLNGTNN